MKQQEIAELNPLRYRGYYYDSETGYYYLQSRYYDPELGRFISADSFSYVDTCGKFTINAYIYCANNPVLYFDPDGYDFTWATVLNIVAFSITIDSLFPGFRMPSDISFSYNENARPYRGKPGSTYHAPDGSYRVYGEDGFPKLDYDSNDHGNPSKHPHDENGGHYHDWNGSNRGDAYAISAENIFNIILVVAVVIVIVILALDDLTIIGASDDFLLAPLVLWLKELVAI